MIPTHGATENLLTAPEFSALRALRRALARGGLPPVSRRRPHDEARIAAFFTVQQLLHILEEFRKACARGEAVRLAVSETGMSPTRVHMTIAIVAKGQGEHG